MNFIKTEIFSKELSEFGIKILNIAPELKHEILFTYLPKMNLVEYLCSVGGLVSMWFGISVYDFVMIFVEELKRKIIYLFVSINFQFVILMILKFREIISSKFDRIFSIMTIIVFTILMFIQTIEIIRNYTEFEIVTRFDVQEIKLLPKIVFFSAIPVNNLNKLIRIYPEMEQKIKKFKVNNISDLDIFEKSKLDSIYMKYLMRLLIDNRLNDFHRITETNKFIKTCQLEVEYDFKSIKCNEGDFGIKLGFYSLMELYHFNYSKLIDKNKIEKITFVLNKFDYVLSVHLFLSHSRQIPKKEFLIASNFKTTITFSSFSVKKLPYFENDCIEEKK
jgi:hypothetical protein